MTRRRDPAEIMDEALRLIGEIAIEPREDAAFEAAQEMQAIAERARLRANRLRPTRPDLAQRPVLQDRH